MMSKDWTDYAQLRGGTQVDSNLEYVGMSDDEEMSRMAASYQDSDGLGEIIVEMPDSEEAMMNELRELGLVEDE